MRMSRVVLKGNRKREDPDGPVETAVRLAMVIVVGNRAPPISKQLDAGCRSTDEAMKRAKLHTQLPLRCRYGSRSTPAADLARPVRLAIDRTGQPAR
ncbi:MAG: hypothetical protein ACRD2N_23995 [Vicinamibacterales bacterium]